MGKAAASGIVAPPPRPLAGFGLGFVAEVAADQLQVGAYGLSVLNQGMRRIEIAADRRLACTEDAGFFEADFLARVAEEIHVIEIDAGDDGAVRFVNIYRIETAAEHETCQRLGFVYGQGYRYGVPATASTFVGSASRLTPLLTLGPRLGESYP